MSVTGTWNLTLNSPLGDQAATLQIQEAGGAYAGTLQGKAEPTAVEELKVDGGTSVSPPMRIRRSAG